MRRTTKSFRAVFAAQAPTLLNTLAECGEWQLEVVSLGDAGNLAEMQLLKCDQYGGGPVDAIFVCSPMQWHNAGQFFPEARRVWVVHNGRQELIPLDLQPTACLAFSDSVAASHQKFRPDMKVHTVIPSYRAQRIWSWRKQKVWTMQNRPETRRGEIQAQIDWILHRAPRVRASMYGQGQPCGFLDERQRAALLNSSSAYLSPLYPLAGFSLAIHECFAAGVPVVTTRWGDMKGEMPLGYSSMSDDCEILVQQLELLALDEKEGRRIGEELSAIGLDFIETYRTATRMRDGIANLVAALID